MSDEEEVRRQLAAIALERSDRIGEEIRPLMNKIQEVCERENVPFIAAFQFGDLVLRAWGGCLYDMNARLGSMYGALVEGVEYEGEDGEESN